MKYLILLTLLIAPIANADVATFTYRFNQIPNDTKTDYPLWACEYKTKTAKVILTFEFYCPGKVELNNYGR